jgi:DNA-binding SARP family transcriptional activator
VTAVDDDVALWSTMRLKPILVCLLGSFRLLKVGRPVALRFGGKTEALVCYLALRHGHGVPRETLLESLWPSAGPDLAGQSLNSLVYGLHRLLGDAIGGARPVLHSNGAYWLNVEAGIDVDVTRFDALTAAGDARARTGNSPAAISLYLQAADCYTGDLCFSREVWGVVESERLRARYLTLLSVIADYYFEQGDYQTCMVHAQALLTNDPCREDAHRLVMCCHVRRGERAQALRQYRTCEMILRREFEVVPEPSTCALFDRIKLDPTSI